MVGGPSGLDPKKESSGVSFLNTNLLSTTELYVRLLRCKELPFILIQLRLFPLLISFHLSLSRIDSIESSSLVRRGLIEMPGYALSFLLLSSIDVTSWLLDSFTNMGLGLLFSEEYFPRRVQLHTDWDGSSGFTFRRISETSFTSLVERMSLEDPLAHSWYQVGGVWLSWSKATSQFGTSRYVKVPFLLLL